MRIDRSLRADFAWVLSGNVVYSACQWGVVLVLAKCGTPEQVGEYALGMAVSAPVITFANLQLRSLLASDVQDEYSFSQYLTFRGVSLAVALAAIAGIVACTESSVRLGTVIFLLALSQVFEWTSDAYYGLMQKFERMDRISRSLMIKGPLSLASLAVVLLLTHNLVWAVAAFVLGRLVVLLQYDSRVNFQRKPVYGPVAVRVEWKGAAMLRLLRIALPLGIISTLGSLNSSIPRYFIQAHSGSRALGIFSAIASLMSAGDLVTSAFSQSVFLPVAKACAGRDRHGYRALLAQVVLLGLLLGGGAVGAAALAGHQVLRILFRPEYAGHVDVFLRLMVAAGVGYIASGLGNVMTAARRLNPQIPVLLASGVTATAACAWLVPGRGIIGAADAVLLASLVKLAGGAVILLGIDRRLRPRPDDVYLRTTSVAVR